MLSDVLEGLAQVLRDTVADELADSSIDIEVEPRMVLEPSAPICVDVYPGSPSRVSDGAAFGDLSGLYVLTVRARVSANDGDEAQAVLLDMIDDLHALSVAAALESDQALDGYATFVAVDPDGFSGLLEFPASTVAMPGCTWRVLVGVAQS